MGSSTGLGATTRVAEVVLKEKEGAGFAKSCSVRLSGAWSNENILPPLIPPKEGLGASIVDERVLSRPGVLSLPTKALGSILEGLCDPKVKGRGDGED